jgi:competence protein ComEC
MTALGAGYGRFSVGTALYLEELVVVAVLGVLAVGSAGVRGVERRARPWLVLLAWAVALRAAGAPAAASPAPGSSETPSYVIAGGTKLDRRRVVQRDRVQWQITEPSTATGSVPQDVRIETAEGAVRQGDEVALLSSAEVRRRARSRDLPRRERPLPRRPLVDELIRTRSGAPGIPWAQPLRNLREGGVRRIERMENPATRGLLCALLFGDTSRLPYGMADLFTRTGTRHMLALSGLHVGLLGVLIALPLARVLCGLAGLVALLAGYVWRPSPALPGAALALAFIPLAGQGAPASRAATALALALIAPALNRRALGLNLVAAALLFEIACDPLAPLRTGVQLSYLATAALIAAASPASRRALEMLPGGGTLRATWPSGRRRSPWLRVAAEHSLRVTVMALATSVVASVATLPVVWSQFGEFSPVGMIATPLAFPPLVLLVAGGWMWLVLSSWAPLGEWAAPVWEEGLGLVTESMLELLAWADRAPWSPLPLPDRPLLWLGFGSWMILKGLRQDGSAGRRLIRVGVALYGLALLPSFMAGALPGIPIRPLGLEVHVMDVGSGTAVLVRAPGEPTWVVDAGSRDRASVATGAVAPALRALDVGKLRVSLSHDDADHAGALPWIARRWPVDLWVGPAPSTRELPGLGTDPLSGLRQVSLRAGSQRVTPEGAALEILAVHGGDFSGNEGSSMLDVRWSPPRSPGAPAHRTYRIILSGDAEGHGLAAMLSLGHDGRSALEPGPVDALLLPHHGSQTPHLGWLLDHLQPREVWGSGSEPPLGQAELERRAIPVRATSEVGGFIWQSQGAQFEIE